MDICLLWVLSGRGLSIGLVTRTGGDLPTVARLGVWSRNLVNEEALALWGLFYKKKKVTWSFWALNESSEGSRCIKTAFSTSWLMYNFCDREHWTYFHCPLIYFPCYTGCPRRNVRDFGRVFLMLNYADITQNTYIQIWTVT